MVICPGYDFMEVEKERLLTKTYIFENCNAQFVATEQGWQCTQLDLGDVREEGEEVNKIDTLIFKTYHNFKYDFSVDYPSNFLIAQPEADMGDGRVFISKSGETTLTAVYEYVDEEQLEQSKNKLNAVYDYYLKKYDKQLDFKHIDLAKGFFFLMGRKDGLVYSEMYRIKDIFVCSCTLSYPEIMVEEYKEMSK